MKHLNFRLIGLYTIVVSSSIFTISALAQTAGIQIQTDITNAVQTIKKINITTDGLSPNANNRIVTIDANADNKVEVVGKINVGNTGNDTNGDWSSILGGEDNKLNGKESTIGGGFKNLLTGNTSTILGGRLNILSGDHSSIVGGININIIGDANSIVGGQFNQVNGTYSTIAGGSHNSITGDFSFIAGGENNLINNGNFNTAAGRFTKVVNSGIFIWSDSYDRIIPSKRYFTSFMDDMFLIRARNGMRIFSDNTINQPGLEVLGNIKISEYNGNQHYLDTAYITNTSGSQNNTVNMSGNLAITDNHYIDMKSGSYITTTYANQAGDYVVNISGSTAVSQNLYVNNNISTSGNITAKYYCDADGENCKPINQVGYRSGDGEGRIYNTNTGGAVMIGRGGNPFDDNTNGGLYLRSDNNIILDKPGISTTNLDNLVLNSKDGGVVYINRGLFDGSLNLHSYRGDLTFGGPGIGDAGSNNLVIKYNQQAVGGTRYEQKGYDNKVAIGLQSYFDNQGSPSRNNIIMNPKGYISAVGNDAWIVFFTSTDGSEATRKYMTYDSGGNLTLQAGAVTANAFYYNSDIRLKTNITHITDALSKILSLNGYLFTWKASGKHDMGVIAQEIEKVFPEIIKTDDNGFKSVEYANLVAPIIEAIKSLNDNISSLYNKYLDQESRIQKLEQEIKLLQKQQS